MPDRRGRRPVEPSVPIPERARLRRAHGAGGRPACRGEPTTVLLPQDALATGAAAVIAACLGRGTRGGDGARLGRGGRDRSLLARAFPAGTARRAAEPAPARDPADPQSLVLRRMDVALVAGDEPRRRVPVPRRRARTGCCGIGSESTWTASTRPPMRSAPRPAGDGASRATAGSSSASVAWRRRRASTTSSRAVAAPPRGRGPAPPRRRRRTAPRRARTSRRARPAIDGHVRRAGRAGRRRVGPARRRLLRVCRRAAGPTRRTPCSRRWHPGWRSSRRRPRRSIARCSPTAAAIAVEPGDQRRRSATAILAVPARPARGQRRPGRRRAATSRPTTPPPRPSRRSMPCSAGSGPNRRTLSRRSAAQRAGRSRAGWPPRLPTS